MAFTLETVKAYGGTGSDGMINARIAAFTAGTYICLTSSYSADVADDIANSYVAGSLQSSVGEMQVTQEKAASGASTSFKQGKYGNDGEYDNALIAWAYKQDIAGCLPIDESQFSFGAAGKTFEADNPQ
ncbi:MAG TPA: hypothetical protein DDW91_06845 [Shewanella frigidimarina]|nr:hypothetical protein [Shewanella frigidimarina]